MKRITFIINISFFLFVVIFVFGVGIFVSQQITSLPAVAQTEEEKDEDPPQLFNIKIGSVSATSTVISWETNELSDSLINYGLSKNYGIVRDPRYDKIKHSIILDDLLPDMTYYFRITSTDADGNQGISSDYSFKTPPIEKKEQESEGYTEKVSEQGEGGLTERVLEEGKAGMDEVIKDEAVLVKDVLKMIEQIKSEENLEKVKEQVTKQAEAEITPPTIILDYADVEVGIDYAIISWQTDKEANSMVALATENDFDPNVENPYTWQEGDPEEMVLEHVVEVNGLEPSTVYHFQVSSKSNLDLTGRSTDKTFKTKSILPEIFNLQIVKIEEESATIRWTTNVPCSAIVEYTNLNNGKSKLEGNSSYTTAHSIRLTNLIFDTYYSAIIKVESEEGEKAVSDPLTFITTRDKLAPVISKVKTDSTMYPGADKKIQTIISWRTDELAKCQLFYSQGLSISQEPESLPTEEDFANKHVQVATNFAASKVYRFWIVCVDEAGNKGKSEDFTILTPDREESIIDIIISNLEKSFGWVKGGSNN